MITKWRRIDLVLFLFFLLFYGCSKPGKNEVLIEAENLPQLEGDFVYEGWLIDGNDTISTGTFTVQENGDLSEKIFKTNGDKLKEANAFAISIEQKNNNDPSPGKSIVLAGEFDQEVATLSTNHSLSLNTNFSTASGTYILATVTDAIGTTHEYSGVWWVQDITASEPGLTLPTLPTGWIYEGWVMINETYVSTGRFNNPNAADLSSLYGDTQNPSLNYPGEDLLFNAPNNVTFPINLKEDKIVISIEPDQQSNSVPYLEILTAAVPSTADYNAPYSMINVSSDFPTAVITRKE
ncbi:MAG: anti-sigma factor [Crocinitomicaceae bacterium]